MLSQKLLPSRKPNLDAQAGGLFSRMVFRGPRLREGRLEALLSLVLLMYSVWTDCASSRQNPSKADTMLCSCCHRLPVNLLQMPKLATRFRKTPSASDYWEGRYFTSASSPL